MDKKDHETGRFIAPGAEEELGKEHKILNYGFVRLVDYMGNDNSIVQAARTSYGKGTTKTSQDRALIRYLMRRRHTTPFEMIETKWHAKMPIFVARQWVRHRTASLNEYSGRYSIMPNEFYLPEPERIQIQSKTNRQGSSIEEVPPELQEKVLNLLKQDATNTFDHYNEIEKSGIARELARIGLPLSTYTQWYWKMDLHNLFHFLGLRMDKHSQWEMRQYANKIGEITEKGWPLAYESFEDYALNSFSLSSLEQKAVKNILDGATPEQAAKENLETTWERGEFLDKWKNIQDK